MMASLYQKYRAKNFDEIVGHDLVKNILIESLKTNQISNSYIFFGTRGAGKTSISRIFARALNCQSRLDNYNPCNTCDSCKASLSGNHPDIVEMDAASNRGIDDARSLKESILNLPSLGKYKVYIIDEAHMMTKEAFNALLKTIEEPPEHVVFIFCTTEVRKLPITIISRSQVFTLRNATLEELKSKVRFILTSENVSMDDNSIEILCKLGNGSYRDTESLLEKVLVQSKNNHIDISTTRNILGIPDDQIIEEIYKFLHGQIDLDINQLINYIALYNPELIVEMYVDYILDKLQDKSVLSNDLTNVIELVNFIGEIKNFNKPDIALVFKLAEIREKNLSHSFNNVNLQSKNGDKKLGQTYEVKNKKDDTPAEERTVSIEKKHNQNGKNETEEKSTAGNEDEICSDKISYSKTNFIQNLKQKMQEKNKFLYKVLESSLQDLYEEDNCVVLLVKDKKAFDILSKLTSKTLIKSCLNNSAKSVEIKLVNKEKKEDNKAVEDLSEEEILNVFDID